MNNNETLRKALLVTAVVALVVMALAAGVMLRRVAHGRTTAIIDDAPLASLRQQLAEDPDDKLMRTQLREMDHARMREHFADVELAKLGGWVLLAGAVVLIGSLAAAAALERRRFARPHLKEDFSTYARTQHRAQLAMVAAMALIAMAGGYFAMPPEKPLVAPVAKLKLDSKRFRGNDGSGHISATFALPASGELASVWKTKISLPGKGSPVAVGDRVYVAAATASSRKVICVQASTGRVYWEAAIPTVPGSPAAPPDVLKDDGEVAGTGYAAASMAADDERVYALFANGDIAALNFDGRIVWAKHLLTPENQYGLATSPIVWGDRVVIQFDQSPGEDDEGNEKFQSTLFYLDAKTGGEIKRIARKLPDSWATPLVVPVGKRELLITAVNPWVIAYDRDGVEAWRYECLTGDVAPSPTFADGRVFVTMEGAGLFAIDPATGKELWTHTEGDFPDIVSPLATAEFVWTLTTGGLLRCFGATSGKELSSTALGARYYASPILLSGGRILLLSADGKLQTIRATGKYEVIARASLAERIYATPLLVGETMILRARRKLLRIDSPVAGGAK